MFSTDAVERQGGNSDLLFITLRGMKKGEPEHFFQVSKGGEVVEENAKTIEGDFVKVINDEYEYDGRTIKSYKLFLRDGEEEMCFSVGYNGVGKSIAMSLAGIQKPGRVVISLFMNGKYKNADVYNDGDKAQWFLDLDEQKKLTRVVNDPETNEYLRTDDSKLVAKIEKALESMPNLENASAISEEE